MFPLQRIAFSGRPLLDITGSNWIWVGNSLVKGYQTGAESDATILAESIPTRFGTQLAAYDITVHNNGVSGQTTQEMINAFSTQVSPYIDDEVDNYVVLWEVINGNYYDAGTAANGYNKVVTYYNMCISAGCIPIVPTIVAINDILPGSGTSPAGDTRAQEFAKLVQIQTMLLSGDDIPLRRIWRFDQIPQTQNRSNSTYFQADEVHFKPALNIVIGNYAATQALKLRA